MIQGAIQQDQYDTPSIYYHTSYMHFSEIRPHRENWKGGDFGSLRL